MGGNSKGILVSIMLISFYQSLLDRYSWYQNGSQIKDNTEIVANKNTGELVISKKCTNQNLGLFYCRAENKYGSTVSPFVKISEPGNQNNNTFKWVFKKTIKLTKLSIRLYAHISDIWKKVANEILSNFHI